MYQLIRWSDPAAAVAGGATMIVADYTLGPARSVWYSTLHGTPNAATGAQWLRTGRDDNTPGALFNDAATAFMAYLASGPFAAVPLANLAAVAAVSPQFADFLRILENAGAVTQPAASPPEDVRIWASQAGTSLVDPAVGSFSVVWQVPFDPADLPTSPPGESLIIDVSFLYTTTGPAPIAIAGHIALVAGINPQLGSPNGVTLVHTANVGVTGGIMDQLSDTATIPDATISVNDTHLKFVYEGILDPGADPYTITFQSFRVVMRSAP